MAGTGENGASCPESDTTRAATETEVELQKILFVGSHDCRNASIKSLLKLQADVKIEDKVEGFSLESVVVGNLDINTCVWDPDISYGGRDPQRVLFQFLFPSYDGVILIIDAGTEDKVLHAMLFLRHYVVAERSVLDIVILVNREDDCSPKITPEELEDKIKSSFNDYDANKNIVVMPGNVSEQDSIFEALTIHNKQLRLRRDGQSVAGFTSYLREVPSWETKASEVDAQIKEDFIKKVQDQIAHPKEVEVRSFGMKRKNVKIKESSKFESLFTKPIRILKKILQH